MKIPKLFFLFFLLISFSANATNHYFSSSTGNDVTGNGSIGQPFASLGKLNSIFSTFIAGDSILLKRGDTFLGKIIINKSGTSGAPFIFSGYGVGANPIVSGFTTITTWTNLGNNIWESTSAISTLTSCNEVVINGVNTAMGRFPNTGYFPYQSSTTTTKTSTSVNSTTTNWTGAQLVVRLTNWLTDRDTITSMAGNKITHTYHSAAGAGAANFGFFIQNDVRTLDVQNEWYYNPSTKKLRIFSATAPTGVRASTIDTLLFSTPRDFFTINGIDFMGSNKITLCIPGSQGVTIQNCNFNFAGYDMLWGAQNFGSPFAPNFIFRNNTVNHTNNNVITVASEFTSAYVGHNIFKNTGLQPGMGGNGSDASFGTDEVLQMRGDGTTIEYNLFDSVGYIPINPLANTDTIRFNEITHYDMTKMDGGGIYTWNGIVTNGVEAPAKTGNAAYNNIIHDADGSTAIAGTNGTIPLVHGVYLDANTRFWHVYNNSFANLGYGGIYNYSGSSRNNYSGNTSYNNGVTQILITNQFANSFSTILDTLNNNIFFAKAATQLTGRFTTRDLLKAYTDSMGTFTNNYYARPIDDNLTILTISSGSVTANNNLGMWQTVSSNDVGSKKSPVAITNLSQLFFAYNATNHDSTVSLPAGTYIDVKGVTYNTGSTILHPYTSVVLINTGANQAPIANAGTNKNITLPTSTITQVGSGTDDGAIVGYSWTQFSGPSTATIVSPSSSTTVINSLIQGVYVFQLKVTDNFGLTGVDTMSVVVNSTPVNIPPTVNAGGNKNITLPVSTITQNGSATPGTGTIVSYAWSQSVSNPIPVTFVSPTNPVTVVNGFFVSGVYSITLSVTDNLGSVGTQTVSVIVNVPIPIAPVSHAGTDQVITWPANSVTLSGSGTDADGVIAAYSWAKISGGAATISNSSSASTSVTGMLPGVYQFQLTVTDNSGMTGSDTVQITVNKGNTSLSFSGLSQTYTGGLLSPGVTTSPAGLSFSLTLNGTSGGKIDAGSYSALANINDPNWNSTLISGTFNITTAAASISVGNLNQTFDSTLKSVSVTTNPLGLNTITTYSHPPLHAGPDTVITVLNDPNHTATPDTSILMIAQAIPVVTWATPSAKTYPFTLDGTVLNAGCRLSGIYIYTPAAGAVPNPGSNVLSVNFTANDSLDYAKVNGTSVILVINKGSRTINVIDTSQSFDGSPKFITAFTTPTNIDTLTVTYDDSHTSIGAHTGHVTLSSPLYTATTVNFTLHITANIHDIFITNFANLVYNTLPQIPTVTTAPPGLPFTLTYNGGSTPPTNVSSTTVIGTLNSPNTGADTVIETIIKATPTASWAPIPSGTFPYVVLSGILNAVTSTAGTWAYSVNVGDTLPAGVKSINAIFTPTDAANYNSITITNTITISKGAATLSLSNTSANYDGTPKFVVVTTNPANLAGVTITGSPQTNAGAHPVSASLTNANWTATTINGVLTINKLQAILSWIQPMSMPYGTQLGPIQLTATSDQAGHYVYNFPAGFIPPVGQFTVIGTFVPDDPTNISGGTISRTITVFAQNPFSNFLIGRYFLDKIN